MTDHAISSIKLMILAVLGSVALLLACLVGTLQLYVLSEQGKRGLRPGWRQRIINRNHNKENMGDNIHGGYDSQPNRGVSIASSDPTLSEDLHMWSNNYPPPDGEAIPTVGAAHWKTAQAVMSQWDAVLAGNDGTSEHAYPSDDWFFHKEPKYYQWSIPPSVLPEAQRKHAEWSLQQAADAGHPVAQFYRANEYASGIPAISLGSGSSSNSETLKVQDEWIATQPGPALNQLTHAMVLWQFAAISGHVESAMALGYRVEQLAQYEAKAASEASATTASDQKKKGRGEEERKQLSICEQALPYYEAAAHGIMDELESSWHSRAKVLPIMDKHTLAKVHLHGGTSSQLDWENKPDESKEALQFIHYKATTTPWQDAGRRTTRRQTERRRDLDENQNAKSKKKKKKKDEPKIDVNAAYTLGHLYHHGYRGVPQNLTLSLHYYTIAGTYGHWESAGHAGTFYLWGMGVKQDLEEAKTFFKLGAPFGFEGCRRRQEQATLQAAKGKKRKASDYEDDDYYGGENDDSGIVTCDATSLNGMGLLYLLGIEDVMEIDLTMAEKYFTLAKEKGNADAMYNLAMMWLGWKTHFKNVEDLEKAGSSDHPEPNFMDHGNKKGSPTFALHVSRTSRADRHDVTFKGPTQSELTDAMKLLAMAANKGHLQAKHRLAMIYSRGIDIRTHALVYPAVKPDCTKARGLYGWIVDNASPQRSQRLRKGYKDYTNGDLESSLRNYLAAAETGSTLGQVNAAFLLERGTCLGMSAADCAKASVRQWKVAAQRGHAEAYLRVGDFYYYGRLRDHDMPMGAFGWFQYVLYPEEYLPNLLRKWGQRLWDDLKHYLNGTPEPETVSVEDDDEDENQQGQDIVQADLSMAAHYYQIAVEKYQSSRANFNLGFMHEWGVGLKQDFPLAKRHYDLAKTNHGNKVSEAEIAVLIALRVMKTHEYFVKLQTAWNEWKWTKNWTAKAQSEEATDDGTPQPQPAKADVGQPVPGGKAFRRKKTTTDVLLSHLLDGTSLVILALSLMVLQLMNMRARRGQR